MLQPVLPRSADPDFRYLRVDEAGVFKHLTLGVPICQGCSYAEKTANAESLNTGPKPGRDMSQFSAVNLITSAYNLALILVGGSDSAESIVTAAIKAVPSAELSEATLLTEVASTAWDTSEVAAPVLDEFDGSDDVTGLSGLRDLCELPRSLRYCFSLRFLAGLTSYACGKIVGLRADQVDYLVVRSMLMLAKAAEHRDQQMLTVAR